jgi:hypothetical protein
MEPADLGDGMDPPARRRLDVSWDGAVVLERLMWTRAVVVGTVTTQEPAQMGFAENQEVVEALAADRADDPLHERVLPGRARGDADLADPQPFDATRKILTVDRVSIPEEVSRRRVLRKGLDQLARCPDGGGVIGDVEVEEFAAIVAEDDEDEEQAEGEGGDHEEVDGNDVVDVGL